MEDKTLFVEIHGNRLYYEELGPDNRQAILCFPGAPGLSDHHEPKASWGRLADRYRVIVQDQRGSGQAGLNPPFTHKQWVDDAEALRQYLGLGAVVVAGGSYGGFLSQEYALAYPQNVVAVMLRDTSVDHRWDEQAEANALASPRVKESLDYDKFRRIISRPQSCGLRDQDFHAEALALFDHFPEPEPPARQRQEIVKDLTSTAPGTSDVSPFYEDPQVEHRQGHADIEEPQRG